MRRKHVRLLANCARLALLGICCAAGGTAAIWTWQRPWVDQFQQDHYQQRVQVYFDRLEALRTQTDAAQRELGYRQLLSELASTRRQDRVAEVVLDCYWQLSALAESKGDLATAWQWMDQRMTFDDRDVIATARIGDLESRIPELREAGRTRLQALNTNFPGHPVVARAFVASLLRSGEPLEASQALDAAVRAPRSNLWTIGWDVGRGVDRQTRRVETVPTREQGETTFRFRIDEPIVGIGIFPPAFHSAVFERPRLEYGDGKVIDLTANCETWQVRVQPGMAVTTGDGGPWLTTRWDEAIPAGTPLVLRWRESPMPEFAVGSCLTLPELGWIDRTPEQGDPALVARLRSYRARGAASGPWQVFWCRQGEAFGGDRQHLQPLVPVPDDGGCTVSGQFQVTGPADVLRLDFPEGQGVTYRMSKFEVLAGDDRLDLDLAQVPMLGPHAVERRGGAFFVTGSDPYFSFALPHRIDQARVLLTGVAR